MHAEELQSLLKLYEKNGYFDEVISLMEAGLGLERAHMGMFSKSRSCDRNRPETKSYLIAAELSVLYAKYRPEKREYRRATSLAFVF